jgi:hypothetical protein
MNFNQARIGFILTALSLVAAGCDTAAPAAARATDRGASAPAPASEAPRAVPVEAPGEAATSTAPAAVLPPKNAAGVYETTFDDIKFEMEKTELFQRAMLTPKIEALAGQQINIRGYMFPTSTQNGITQFVLVRDNLECCFGPGAALFDCILVRMEPGKTTSYSYRPIAVQGKFGIQEMPGPDGRPLAIYHMTGETVQ